MLEHTRFYSIIFNKCPSCHKGNFFMESNPFNLKTFSNMHKNCNVCKESFERETGFYVGAMYASYGLTVAYGLALFLLLVIVLKLSLLIFLITFTLSVILFCTWIYRKSRLIWINLFVGYKKQKTIL
jgi:hypothetical protein